MNFIKEHWNKEDIEELRQYELTQKGDELHCSWEQRIMNTKYECFGKTAGKVKLIVKDIKKGNYLELIDNLDIKNQFESLLVAFLITNIKDEKIFKEKLDKFSPTIDNWCSVDTIRFVKKSYPFLKALSDEYISSKHPFKRRIAVSVYFAILNDEKCLNDVFKLLDYLKNEKEYYVNMCGAWLLAEAFAKHKEETLKYLDKSKTNDFIINKGISKCRDSRKISDEDKQMLLEYKR